MNGEQSYAAEGLEGWIDSLVGHLGVYVPLSRTPDSW